MTFRNCVLAVMLLTTLMSVPAWAASVTVNGKSYTMSDTEAAQFALDASKKQDEGQAPAVTVDNVSRYAEIGKTIGASLASTAKEMGVAVNDFATTPVGVMASYLIVYKLIGREILHIIVGGAWLLAALPTWFYIYRRTCIIKGVQVYKNEQDKTIREVEYYLPSDRIGERQFGNYVILLIVTVVGIMVMFL